MKMAINFPPAFFKERDKKEAKRSESDGTKKMFKVEFSYVYSHLHCLCFPNIAVRKGKVNFNRTEGFICLTSVIYLRGII